MTFAEELRQWRGTRYQKEAADALGVEYRTYKSWELGERLPNKLAMIEIRRRMDVLPDKKTPHIGMMIFGG